MENPELPIISANALLDRKPDASYIEEWTALLQREISVKKEADEQSVVVFRLGEEWLAVSTSIFSEIAPLRPLHRIPHRSGPLLLGLINLRGQLRLCISLHDLLQIEKRESSEKIGKQKLYARLVAVRKGAERWIFPVDEV